MPPSHTMETAIKSYATANLAVHIEGDTIGLTLAVPELAAPKTP
jgi:hypothetical protein